MKCGKRRKIWWKIGEESEFDSFEVEKVSRDPLSDPLYGPKIKIFTFELDQYFDVKFYGESDVDSPEAQKPYLDPHISPLLTPSSPRNKNFQLWDKRINLELEE